VGTTAVVPLIWPSIIAAKDEGEHKGAEDDNEKNVEVPVLPDLGYARTDSSGLRRARWERTGNRWRIEGFDGT